MVPGFYAHFGYTRKKTLEYKTWQLVRDVLIIRRTIFSRSLKI